ncbi:MAG: prophage regulatory protein [Porticoccus sp.]|jgi:prophage regulatory protein
MWPDIMKIEEKIMADQLDRICKLPEVQNLTGLSSSRIYALMAEGNFPSNFKLSPGGRASGWLLSDVNKYLAGRASERSQCVAA